MLNPIAQSAATRFSTAPDNTVSNTTTHSTDIDWGDFKNGSMRIGQGKSELLVPSVTDRALSIRRFEDGVIEMELKQPDIERLVLSGGGAKGVAFSGMVKALEADQALDKIRTISGSSAGAISAAFLASGMGHADFDKLSDETNLVELLDSQHKLLSPIQHLSSVIGKGISKLPGGNIGKLLFDLIPRLQSKAMPLEALIEKKMVDTIQTRLQQALSDPQRQVSQDSKNRVEQIKANGYVTFGDLAVLSKDMPEIKQLNITGTAMFDHRPQMVVFNASLTPDMNVARAAHISGSLPIVFQKPAEQGLAFQADGERTSFQDGGLMLNTPVMELYELQFPMSPIPDSDQLILKFEEGSSLEKDRGTLTSALTDKFVGVSYAAKDAQAARGIKAFDKQTVVVPLKTEKGDFRGTFNGTVNFGMPLEYKNHLQQKLEMAVGEHLKRHASTETFTFNSIGGALLALDDRLFDAAATALANDPDCAEVIQFRQQAQHSLAQLSQALLDAKATQSDKLVLTDSMSDAINRLDQLGDNPGKIEWLAKKINHGNAPDFMELLQAVRRIDSQIAGPKSPVMTQAIEEMGVRDIKTKSENFIREVIYPSLYRLGQPDSNVKLLTRTIVELRASTNAQDFNAALHRIVDQYVSRSLPNSMRPFSSPTIDQARAWLIPGG